MSLHSAHSATSDLVASVVRSTRSMAGSQSLPPAVFHDESWYEREKRLVFESSWIAVGRSTQVAQPTDFLTAVIGDEPVVVTRDREGVLRALSNVCRHRSMTIVDGAGSAAAIRCPYHLWTYRLDGTLAGAPSMADDFDAGSVCLPEFAVSEWQGWVFVNIDETADPIVETMPTLDAILSEHGMADMVHVGTLNYPSAWNWKISVENFSESYHHRGVHPETLDSTYPGFDSFVPDANGEPWGAVDHISVVDGFDPFLAVVAFPTLAFAVLRGVGMTWFRIEPLTATTTQLTIEMFTHPDMVELGDEIVGGTKAINDEDVPINERTAMGLRSRFAEPGPVSPLERACWQFRRWLADAMSK